MSLVPKTDVVRRAPLDTGLLRAPRQGAESNQTSDEYLAHIEEEWNKKIDVEIETLVSGMTALVDIASIKEKDKYQASQEAFQAECRAESMALAASSLLSITHSLKLMLLVGDEDEISTRRAQELERIHEQIAEAKEWAVKGWETLRQEGREE